jgi:hypothetical protein
VALLLALLIAGCDEGGDQFDPGTLPTDTPNTATGGGGDSDTTGVGLGNALLVGRWQNVLIVETDTDVQQITTTWLFEAVGTCRRTVLTESILAGTPLTSVRQGTCQATSTQLFVRYEDALEDVVFPISFVDFDIDRLLIGQVEFGRLEGTDALRLGAVRRGR